MDVIRYKLLFKYEYCLRLRYMYIGDMIVEKEFVLDQITCLAVDQNVKTCRYQAVTGSKFLLGNPQCFICQWVRSCNVNCVLISCLKF